MDASDPDVKVPNLSHAFQVTLFKALKHLKGEGRDTSQGKHPKGEGRDTGQGKHLKAALSGLA